jgi:hypothetical protein
MWRACRSIQYKDLVRGLPFAAGQVPDIDE